jgi:hypothetical protein
VILIEGAVAVAAPLTVLVPLTVLLEDAEVVLDTVLEMTVGSVANALSANSDRAIAPKKP